MMTKAEERKALEKVKKILEECGADSYIGMAFAGCVQMAESNIENDFGENPQERIESLEEKLEAAKKSEQYWMSEYKNLSNTKNAELSEKDEIIAKLRHENHKAVSDMNDERKDVTVATEGGEKQVKPFAKIQFINHEGFRFVNIVEKSGWTNSHKIDELTELTIQ